MQVRKSSIGRPDGKVEMRQSVKERPSYNERDHYEERTSTNYYNSRNSRQQVYNIERKFTNLNIIS